MKAQQSSPTASSEGERGVINWDNWSTQLPDSLQRLLSCALWGNGQLLLSASLTRGLLPLDTQGQLFWQFSTVNCRQKMPTAQRFLLKLTQKSDSFLQELLPSVHANSNKNTDPPNRAELIVRSPGELKEFKNIQNMSLHQKQAGVQMTFSFLHSLPTKFMPHPQWDPLHTQPLHRALSSSACNFFFQQGEHHQTGVFSGFATKLRLTWK